MKITRRVALSQAAGAGLLAACGGSRQAKTPALPAVTFDQPVAITFFHSQNAANGKALQDMVDKVNQSKESLDDIFPAYLEGLRFPQYGNQLLSFPFTKSLVVMYVNEEVLQRANVKLPPNGAWTCPDFAQAVQAASRPDRSLIVDQEIGNATDPSRLRTFGWANHPSASTINAWA